MINDYTRLPVDVYRNSRNQNDLAGGPALLDLGMNLAYVGQRVLGDLNFEISVDRGLEEIAQGARHILQMALQVEAADRNVLLESLTRALQPEAQSAGPCELRR